MSDLQKLVDDVIGGSGSIANVKAAVANGGDVNASKASGTALSRSVNAHHVELVSMLLAARALPDVPDQKGVTPLHLAAFDGNLDMIKLLVGARANVDAQDCHGQSPLFFAPSREVCAQLGAVKADVNILNHKGQSALHLAAHAGLNDAVMWLADCMKPAALNAQDRHGRTAVYCAAHSNLKSTILLLQDKGADVTLRPRKYRSSSAQGGRIQVQSTAAKCLDEAAKKAPEAKHLPIPEVSAAVAGALDPAAQSAPGKVAAEVPRKLVSGLVIETKSPRPSGPPEDFPPSKMISPKREFQELPHLGDEPKDGDEDVLNLLSTALFDEAAEGAASAKAVEGAAAEAREAEQAAATKAAEEAAEAEAAAKAVEDTAEAKAAEETAAAKDVEESSAAKAVEEEAAAKASEEEAAARKAEEEAAAAKAIEETTAAAKAAEDEAATKAAEEEAAARKAEEEAAAAKAAEEEAAAAKAAEESSTAKAAEEEAATKATEEEAAARKAEEEAAAAKAAEEEAAAAKAAEESSTAKAAEEEAAAKDSEVEAAAKKAEEEAAAAKAAEKNAAAAKKAEEESAAAKASEEAAAPEKAVIAKPVQVAPPIQKRTRDHCTYWDVEMIKQSDSDKFGFSHSSGKLLYLKALGFTEDAPGLAGPEVIYVRKIAVDGMLHAWNQVHPDATVQPGDRVSKVNGVSTISGMGKELRSPSVAMEIIRYPASFEVELSKRAADDTLRKLGFKFEKPGGHGLKELKITEVGKDGLLAEANNKQAELGLFHYVVASDMRISKVNDVEGDASLISEELKTAEVVKIQIRRAEVQKLAKEKVIKSTELLGMVAALAKPELFARAAAVSKSDGPGSSLEAESQPATSGDEAAAAADAAAAAAAAAT